MPNPHPTAGSAPAAALYRAPRLAASRTRLIVAALAGALLAAAFAPLNLWPLGLLCPAFLMWLWQDVTPREAARLGFAFTTATFIAGTYWLYFSIHVLGQAPIWLALFLMVALAAIARGGALAARAAGRVAAGGMVARLVPRWLLVAVARLLAERHMARKLRAAGRGVRHQRAAAAGGRCAPHAAHRHAPRTHAGAQRPRAVMGLRWGALLALLDDARRAGGLGGGDPGRHPTG